MTQLRLTSWRLLVVVVVASAVVAAVGGMVADRFGVTAPTVPWTAPGLLAIVAAFVAVLAWRMRQRVHVRKEWVEPLSAVRLLALAKACSLVGAAVSGGYLGYLLTFVTRWDVPGPRQRMIVSAVAVLAAAAMAAAGLWLERSCRTPQRDDAQVDDDS